MRSARIAIVDDDAPLRMALDNLIRAGGFETRLFADAETYLDACLNAGCDVVITDIQMSGLSGLDLATALRLRGGTAPVILMTAQLHDEIRDRAFAAGAYLCLQKPFDEHSLFEAIEGALAH